MAVRRRARAAAAAAVAAAGLLASRGLPFAAGGRRQAAAEAGSPLARRAATALVDDERVKAFEETFVIDEAAKVSGAGFPIKPEDLIKLAKVYLAYEQGVDKPEMLAEDFEFAGPVVGPLSKAQYLKAVGGFDFTSAFPDFNPEWHHFRVDPFEPNRVWMTARGYGTNTKAGTNPLLKTATGKKYVNPPQACSLRFNEDGLVSQYTIGYVMDRRVGNTGGLGGLYGILYAIGKPLPFPEANPWKMSFRYKMFQKVGNFLQSLQKKK